jgi:hypothetical protein
VVLRKFIQRAQLGGRAAKDLGNIIKVFIANNFFLQTSVEAFKIPGLSASALKQWQGNE